MHLQKLDTFGGAYFIGNKGDKYITYSPDFKISVIMDMREHPLGAMEAERKYGITHSVILKWERIFI